MLCVSWNPSYDLGIDEIDRQHRFLFEIMDRLCQAINIGKGPYVIGHILDELAGYAKVHFETEEKYFSDFSYKKAKVHIKEHNDFHKKIETLRLALEDGKSGVSGKTIVFLAKWFEDHVSKHDREYITCFRENGVC